MSGPVYAHEVVGLALRLAAMSEADLRALREEIGDDAFDKRHARSPRANQTIYEVSLAVEAAAEFSDLSSEQPGKVEP